VRAIALVDGGAVWPQLLTEAYATLRQEAELTMQESLDSDPRQLTFETRESGVEWVMANYLAGFVRPMDSALAAYAYSFLLPDGSGKWKLHYNHEKLMGSWADLDDLAGAHRLKLLPRSHRSILPEVIYRHLDVPVLLIDPTGDDEALFSRTPWYIQLRDQHSEWIEYVEYADTPHAAHLNRPEWFLRDMNRLLQRTDGSNCIE
jgi:hypothetical protein